MWITDVCLNRKARNMKFALVLLLQCLNCALTRLLLYQLSVTCKVAFCQPLLSLNEYEEKTGSDMPYGHLIAATVMTLGVCQDHSSIATFFILTSASYGRSTIAELLVNIEKFSDWHNML